MKLKKNIPKFLILLFIGLFIAQAPPTEVTAAQPATPKGFSTVSGDSNIIQYNIPGHTFMIHGVTTMLARDDDGYLYYRNNATRYDYTYQVYEFQGERRIRGTVDIAFVGGGTGYTSYRLRLTPNNFSSLSIVPGRSFVDNLYAEGQVEKETLDGRLGNGGRGWLNPIISARNSRDTGSYKEWPIMSTGGMYSNAEAAFTYKERVYFRKTPAKNAPDGGWSPATQDTFDALFDIRVTLPSIDDDPPEVDFSPSRSDWGNSNIRVNVTASDAGTGVQRMRTRVHSNGAWGNWSSWQTSETKSINLHSEGVHRIEVESEDNAGNVGTTQSGRYRIDYTTPRANSPQVTNVRHTNGNNHWVRPGDTFNVRTSAFDNGSKVARHYVRLSGDGNDNRGQHIRSEGSSHLNEYRTTGGYTNIIGSEELSDAHTNTHLFTARANSNSNGRAFEVQTYFRDLAGNHSGSFIPSGQYIRVDGTAPTMYASPSSRTSWSNNNVSVTLTDNNDSGGSGVASRQYIWSTSTSTPNNWLNYTGPVSVSTQGTWYLHTRITDNAGNSRTQRFGPYRIDKTAPTITASSTSRDWATNPVWLLLSYNGGLSGMNTQQYLWSTSTATPPMMAGWTSYSNSFTHSSHGEWYLHVRGVDNAGNVRTTYFGPYRIDTVAPTGSTSVNTSSWTNGNVTITATGSDADSGVRRIQRPNGTWVNGSSASQSVSSNGTYNFVIEDNAGNTRTVSRTISNIDKTAPTGSTAVNTTSWTNGNVTITATGSDSGSGVRRIQRPNGTWVNGSSASQTVSSNGTYSFVIEDNAGNTRTVSRTISNIDKTDPSGSISGNPTNWTNQNATLSFSASDSGSGIRRVRRPNGTWVTGSSTTQTVTSNGTYTFVAEDNAGNTRNVSVTVNRIDKSTPSGSTSVNTSSWTNGNVTITATGSDSNSGIRRIRRPNGTWVSGSSASQTVSSNGTYSFVIEDNAGNTRTVSRTVSNIDKTAPTGSISGNPSSWTNQNVTLSFNASDSDSGIRRVRRPNGTWVTGSSTTQTVSSNGTYTFRAEDNAGNIRDVSVTVNRIDKTAPTGSISGNPSSWTNQDVTLTLSASDSQSGVRRVRRPNGTWVNGSSASQTVSSNGTYTFRIEDVAGNTRDVSATVNRIDKTTPSYTSSDVYGARYVSGNDHWYRPGDAFRVRTIGNDSNSRIMNSYLRLTATGNDNRAVHHWNGSSSTAVNEFSSGTYTEITSGTRGTYNTTAQYTFNGRVLPNAGNRTFNVQYYFRDNAGNNNGYHNTGYRIRTDATAPTITANMGSRGWSNTDATVTLTHADAQSGIATRQFAWSQSTATPSSWSNYSSAVSQTNNGTWYLHARAVDNVGHMRTERFGPYRIDKTRPNGTISGNPTSWTNQDVTLSFNGTDSGGSGVRRIRRPDGTWVNGSSTTHTVSSNGTYTFRVEDHAGNTRDVSANVNRIDKVRPSGTITGNPTSWTNQDVTLAFNATDSGLSGVRRVRRPNGTWVNGSSTTHTVSSNGTYTFRVEDHAGNIRDVSTTVNRIDKVIPNGSISGNPTSWTNQDATLTFSATDSGGSGVRRLRMPNGTWVNGNSASYTVGSNGTYTFRVEDHAGNIRDVSVTVNRIDKTRPNGTITGNATSWTNQDVTLSFNATDSGGSGIRRVRRPDGTWVNSSSTTFTVSSNGTYTFRAQDHAGNIRDVSVTVNRIDKVRPEGTISGNPTNWTNQDVTLSFNATDSGGSGVRRVRRPNGTWVNGAFATHTVKSNGTYTFRVEDHAGNRRDVTVNVTRIDKNTPAESMIEIPE